MTDVEALHRKLVAEISSADIDGIADLLVGLRVHRVDRRIRLQIARLCGERLQQIAMGEHDAVQRLRGARA
ncbi:MAG: hypothetical protein IT454_19165 [Planctomycetes bacterium]|nr:hypothetical protein [Planctomycetota bacterium]